MNIAFCINDKYVEQLLVVLTSLALNNRHSDLDIYVFSFDIARKSEQKCNLVASCFRNLKIHFVHIDNKDIDNLHSAIDYISKDTYSRYLIPELLPNVDKVLYLDADIIINGNLDRLYNMDISPYYVAGSRDLYIHEINYLPEIGFTNDDLYVNAGVLLMNLAAMRRDKISQKLISETQKRPNIRFNDQDIINIICRNHICEIDSIYNYTTHNRSREHRKQHSAVVIHYTGENKPWLLDSHHPIKKLYWKYYKKAEKMLTKRKIRVGLLIDEFFGGAGTAFGGYGFLARRYIAKYIPNANIRVDVLLGGRGHRFTPRVYREDKVKLYRLPRKHWAAKWFLKRKKYDVYLSIELTDDYVLKHETNKNKKLILWIQDPRPKYEWEEINTVKLFRESNYYNQRIYDFVHDWNKKNRVRFISQGYFLNKKAIDLYNLPNNVPIQYLPNPVDIDKSFDIKTYKKKDNIIFLGRIESVKRGWLFCEIAKRMPEYNFYMLGQSFREKDKNDNIMRQYKNIPNLHFAGHVDGDEKSRYLKDAKILVNTSIHEALPVSFLEALAYGVCLVSNRNPEDLTSKFGIWTGQINGDGFDKLDLYIDAIRKIMNDEKLRQKLAISGREYVEQIHNVPRFVNDLRNVIYQEADK